MCHYWVTTGPANQIGAASICSSRRSFNPLLPYETHALDSLCSPARCPHSYIQLLDFACCCFVIGTHPGHIWFNYSPLKLCICCFCYCNDGNNRLVLPVSGVCLLSVTQPFCYPGVLKYHGHDYFSCVILHLFNRRVITNTNMNNWSLQYFHINVRNHFECAVFWGKCINLFDTVKRAYHHYVS